jgi:hypothetical protein
MYNWVTTRKIARTEGPNYPTRAAQTVDAVVAKWIPATAALLSCFVTPARATLDSRYYESPNYPVRAAQTVDATVRTWIPTFDHELAQTRTCDRPTLDVRRYEWQPESFDIVTRVDAQVRTWIPAFDAEAASFRTPERDRLDTRRYDWDVSDTSWIFKNLPAAGPTVAQTAPIWANSDQYRTRANPPLDIRRYEWAPGEESWIESAEVDAQVRTWIPAFDAALASGRTADRAGLDPRRYDWDVSDTSWIFANLPAQGPTVAQASPAWTNQAQNFRTPTAPTPDLSRAHSSPSLFGVPDNWITWVSVQDDGGLTRDRARLDVRAYEWSQPAWIFASLPTTFATVPQQVAVWADRGGRIGSRPSLDVRPTEWSQPAWIFTALPPAATVPQQVSVWTDDGGRTAASPSLDVRRYDWAPSSAWIFAQLPLVPDATVAQQAAIWPTALTFSTRPRGGDVRNVDTQPEFTWVQPVVDAAIAKLAPIFRAELASFRTVDDPRLDVRAYAWAPDAAAWELINFAPPATQAQIWPALLQNLGTQYQTSARPTLDVRRYDWQPEFTWAARVVDTSVAKWAPIFQALIQSSPRTADRERLNVRTLTDRPVGHAWLSALQLTGVLPFPLTTDAVNDTAYTLVSLDDRYTTTDLS